MVSSSPCLLTVPIEVLHHIAEDLTVLTPLGPPSSIVPLMLTCSTLNSRLSVARNPTLFAAIYRRRLDHTAIERRVGRPTLSQWARWGFRVFEAMRIFRRGDIWYDEPELLEALRVGVMFMLDDDGKNVRQMLLWARADVFVQKLVIERIYERAHENQGWPRETPLIAYALQLWYLLSSEESVLSEPPEVRDRIMKLLVPFVYCPFRYASSPYPPNHFIVPPLLPSPAVAPTTIPTAHGQYPLYPDSLSSPFLLANGKTVKISPPQPALMAKLIYMAREEAIPLPIAPDMHRTRAEREAAGITDVGPVQEDIEEFNWSYTTPHPLGTGLRTREGLLKHCQDWNGAEWEAPLDMYDHGYPSLPKRILFGNAVAGAPFPQWATKAPLWDIKEKSKRFDMVFGMMLAFGDLDVGLSRKPFADGVYEPGTADGLWVGRILVSDFHAQEILSSNPMHPPYEELTVESLSWYHQLSFLRLREIHGVQGEVNLLRPPPPMIPSTSEATNNVNEFDSSNDEGENAAEQEEEEEEPFGLGPLEDDDGMSNAWFLNPPTVLPPLFSEPKDIVRLSVPYIARTGIYRANTQFKQHKGGDRLGNSAPALTRVPSTSTPTEEVRYSYPHDASVCPRCRDDEAFASRVKMAVLDGTELHSLLETQRTKGTCTGIREIVILGETDPIHGAAFQNYVLEGRIRPADGLFLGIRRPKDPVSNLGTTLLWGYFVGDDTLVGNWRAGQTDPRMPAWEGTFVWGRRRD